MGAPSAIGKVGTTIGASEKILNFLSKPFIIGGISSGTSTLVGESLETMTGTNKRGIEQIGLDVLEDLILGGSLVNKEVKDICDRKNKKISLIQYENSNLIIPKKCPHCGEVIWKK